MSYVAPPDIRNAVAPDGSFTGTCAELDDDQLNGHIARAQGVVNGYTSVAFNDFNVPVMVKDLTIQLASFYATLAYRKGKELNEMHPVYLAYKDAQGILKGIKDGTIAFDPPSLDSDPVPVRRRPKINNAWRSAADMFPMSELGMRVTTGTADEGYRVEPDPNLSETGFS